MYITKIKILNYKSIADAIINLNKDMNIFVGENDAGKSSILEALSAVLMGRINGSGIVQNLRPSLFNSNARKNYLESIKKYDSGKEKFFLMIIRILKGLIIVWAKMRLGLD